MHEDLQQAVDSGKLSLPAAEALERLTPGAFCLHKSWGFGRVAEWSLLTGQLIIDFQTKKGHPMQAQYAGEVLQAISDEHILARKATNPSAVRAAASDDPIALVRAILRDHGGRATAEQIAASLTPEVFDAAGFKKWWEATKKKLKADGHFQLPTKKTEPFVLLDAPVDPGLGLIEKFRGARHLKDQVAALDQITKALGDFTEQIEELQVLTSQIEDAAAKGRRLHSAQAVELLIARDEILARHETLRPGENAPHVADILCGEQSRLSELFASIPASKQRRALEHFSSAFGDRWVETLLRLAQQAPARLVVEISRLLEKEGRQEDMRAALARWISERSASSEILIWLCKERGAGYPELFDATLLNTVFSALERDQLDEKRGTRLKDLLFEDRELIAELLETAENDVVRDTLRRLLMTPVFEDLSKRSLIARIVKAYPEMQSMITGGDAPEKQETLTVSWASLEKRKEEFEDLVTRQIPENLRDIAIAKEEGDLRENFGFKAAKEQQRVLARRRAESERDLGIARGTNFEAPDTTQVSIGTVITLRDSSGEEQYSILGAWDSAPNLGIVSYKAAIGQASLGKKVGDTIELPTEKGIRSVTITRIEPFTDLETLREQVHRLTSPASA